MKMFVTTSGFLLNNTKPVLDEGIVGGPKQILPVTCQVWPLRFC